MVVRVSVVSARVLRGRPARPSRRTPIRRRTRGVVRTQSDFFLAARGRALDAGSHEYEPWMRRALELAARGRGAVEPNPMVGAVVLDAAGRPVGEGWHRKFGEAHAEVHAFAAAGEKARGGTLVVTLEPCCH